MELYFETREEWHDWLENYHASAEEVWLICYKRGSGKPRISYNDMVEEALCFGWIDGKIRSINRDYYIQRFTPRRKGSRWSKYNIERVLKLQKERRMRRWGLKAFDDLKKNPQLAYENRSDGDPVMADDLLAGLGSSKRALQNFTSFPASVRRMYIDWLNSAKRPETRERRISKIIILSERNIKNGML